MQVDYCARFDCPSVGKAFSKLKRSKKSQKDSDQLQCELVDIHVDGPQEHDAIVEQPIKHVHANKLATDNKDTEDVEILRHDSLKEEEKQNDTAV